MEDRSRSSDEVDLGQLFHLIGRAFERLFNAIGRLFGFIFGLIISFFLFLQKHFIKFVIAGVIGLVLGFIIDRNNDAVYRSTMIVEPNLGSTRQLYSNIDLYSELVRSEDTIELARTFDIKPIEASKIINFSVKAMISQNSMLRSYNEYMSGLDTITRSYLTFEQYAENFEPLDAKTHRIILDATDDRIAKKLEKTIISSITTNPYYKVKQETANLNVETSRKILENQLNDIDTLKKIYNQVIINESKPIPVTGGTNVSLSDKEINTKEFELLQETRNISEEIQNLNIERIENMEIINIISTFPRRGIKLSLWKRRSFIIIMPILILLITFLLLSLWSFNKYLKRYRIKRNLIQ